jgi:putative ABC transport system permease protein
VIIWSRFRRLYGPDPKRDVDDELAFHLEMRIRELIRQGEPPARARERALSRFGDYERSRLECMHISERRVRRMARSAQLAELRSDVSYSIRTLLRAPGFALVAILTLGLGIGATSSIFGVVQNVLLQPLPYPAADRLHNVGMLYPDGTLYRSLSAPDFMSLRAESRVFESVESYSGGTFTLLGSGEPKEVRGASVSDGLLAVLDFGFTLGRGFSRDEFEPGRGMVAVLDHGFWQREFGGDRGVLGRTVVVGGDPYEIVGVLAPDARLPHPVEMYAPLEYDETFNATTDVSRRGEYLFVVARTHPGAPEAAIASDVARVGALLQEAYPATNERLTFAATPLRGVLLGDVSTPLLVLMGAVGFVLLVACANVANLLLARATARRSELAVRAALGAGRGRLLRQLLTESVVLALIGGAAGLLLAWWGTRALVGTQAADIPRLDEVGVNRWVVAFTFGVALLTGIIFGLLPAFQATGRRLERSLREGGRGAVRGGQRARSALIVAEMALAVVLLMSAGLLIRSFMQLTRVDPGFEPKQAIEFRLSMQGDAYPGAEQLRNRVDEFTARIESLPGVTAAGATTVLPLRGLGALVNFEVEGAPPPPENVNLEIAMASTTPSYFRAIGVPLVRGRMIDQRDGPDAPRVAVINEAAARRWFAGDDPIGRFVIAGAGDPREIVGIVADVLQRSPGEPVAPQLFVPYTQSTTRSLRFVVRTAGDPLALAPAIRGEIRLLDPDLPIGEFNRLEQLVADSVARPRFYTSLLTLFAALALALAATGIFGVMSYSVAQRTREISIRMALGAERGVVLRMIVGHALGLAAAGAALGLIGALAFGRLLQAQLFGVGVLDPATIAGVVLVLIATALAASYLPARRALAVPPAAALREA